MSNEKVLQLLGPPKSMGPGTSKWSYVLHSLPNGQNQPSLELEFDQNRNVSRYRCPYLDTFDEGPWFEHNMIFVSAKPGHQWRGKLQAK